MKMKKMLVGAFLGMFAVAGIAVLPNYASAQETQGVEGYWENPRADTQHIGGQQLTGSALLDTIRNAVNWLLGILATVALVICLYGGFLMVTSAGDDKKYGNGLNVLKNAAIGLAIIGLSWMIVSIVFWFVGKLGNGHQTESSSNQNVQTNSQGTSLRDGGDGGDTTDANQGNYNGDN